MRHRDTSVQWCSWPERIFLYVTSYCCFCLAKRWLWGCRCCRDGGKHHLTRLRFKVLPQLFGIWSVPSINCCGLCFMETVHTSKAVMVIFGAVGAFSGHSIFILFPCLLWMNAGSPRHVGGGKLDRNGLCGGHWRGGGWEHHLTIDDTTWTADGRVQLACQPCNISQQNEFSSSSHQNFFSFCFVQQSVQWMRTGPLHYVC